MNPFNIFVFFSSFIFEFLSLVTDHIYIYSDVSIGKYVYLSIPFLPFQKSSRNNGAADNSDDDHDDDEEEDQEVILAFQHNNNNNNNN